MVTERDLGTLFVYNEPSLQQSERKKNRSGSGLKTRAAFKWVDRKSSP
jgi:hypothetical protein